MLCEIRDYFGNFFLTWFVASLLGLSSVLILSTTLFYKYYVNITYEKWLYKINPKYPTPEKVRDEIWTMLKGFAAAALASSFALWLAAHGKSKAYCGVEPYGWGYLIASFFVCWIASDFFEFAWHWCGHKFSFLWAHHKAHHQFFNPSPFAVIADEWLDQFVRATPLLIFPLIAPVNIDMLFFMFATFFYGYGCYLHWGHEFEYPDAHHWLINTSFQHYLHHARSIVNRPYHTGFFIKLWDHLAGSVWDQECFCSKCSRARGERTKEAFAKVEKPNYSVLLSPSFWLNAGSSEKQA